MKKCGLLGRNIQYSISPDIHNKYYREKNIKLSYKLFDIDEESIGPFLMSLNKENIIGFNVTIPYKQAILKYLNRIEYPASIIGAVNTVAVEGDELVGYNTDYYGFTKSLDDYDVNVNGKKALVIGNGGAAGGIVTALEDLNCKDIVVAARDTYKAGKIFDNKFVIKDLHDQIDCSKFDIIINCTPLGGANHIEAQPLNFYNVKSNCIAYDLIYNPKKTLFLNKAEQLGAVIINGESMLYHQAYSAADIWIRNISLKF